MDFEESLATGLTCQVFKCGQGTVKKRPVKKNISKHLYIYTSLCAYVGEPAGGPFSWPMKFVVLGRGIVGGQMGMVFTSQVRPNGFREVCSRIYPQTWWGHFVEP